MKILTVCNYITNDGYIQTRKNNTGYGHMVNDIIFGLAPFVDIDVFTFSGSYRTFNINNVYFKSNFYFDRIKKNIFKSLYQGGGCLFKGGLEKENFRTALSIASSDYYMKIISEYDIIHVHGCTPNLLIIIKLSLEMNKKVVVTLHGLNSISEDNQAAKVIKESEEELFKLDSCDLYFSVLTPTAKGFLIKNGVPKSKVSVIPNFIQLPKVDGHKNYSEEKVVLYIGNISGQKNQKALLDTIEQYKYEFENKVKFIFAGNIPDYFDTSKYDELRNVTFLGQVSRSEVSILYKNADATILLSRVEGFGLSIVEGFSYGLPTIINSDIEICSLLEDKDFIYKVRDVDDCKDILRGINKILSWNGNKKEILEYSKNFSESKIINRYIKLYNDVI
ncbi:glycosyltransferase family 4 protein [Vibrio crassostreae]|uniref:glycosyltransferase family 4 protein n=1 Tax=Vibrio crassostreae TaxID=246167 RepID=UPI001B306AB3|nr:glycosyltransferase family 4 protein [Vibrio crassostreae]